MNHTPFLFSFFLLQFQIVPNTVRMNQYTVPAFIFFSAVSDCIECSQKALFFLQFHIVLDTVIEAPLTVLVFKFYPKVPYRFKYRQNSPLSSLFLRFSLQFQIAPECTIYRLCFHNFLCNSKSFQMPSKCTVYHPCFYFSLQFRIVVITTRMHHLPSLFSFFSVVLYSLECRQGAPFSISL